MIKLDKEQIGEYIGTLIRDRGYNDRQFSKRYLEIRDGELREDLIQNMQNRICQIKKGRKWIQVEDLPIFAEILGVSIEDILSAGACSVLDASRLTNYSVAFSKDPKVWEEYINKEEGIFTNYDEYRKSVIDYALQFKNYKFLKYLLKKGIIWFVGDNRDEYNIHFGAGTKIKRRITYNHSWDSDIVEQDKLRTDMAALAVEKQDYDILDELRARETPELYFGKAMIPDNGKGDYTNTRLINIVARANPKILKYFSETFEIENEYVNLDHCMFPDIALLVKELVRLKSKDLRDVLHRVEEHNIEVLRIVEAMTKEEIAVTREKFGDSYDDEELRTIATHFYLTAENNRTIKYVTRETHKTLGALIVKLDCKIADPSLQAIVDRINSTYEQLLTYGG